MSLLTVVNDVRVRLGQGTVTTVIGNSNGSVAQMPKLLEEVVERALTRFTAIRFVSSVLFTAPNSTEEMGTLATALGNAEATLIPDTFFEEATSRAVLPVSGLRSGSWSRTDLATSGQVSPYYYEIVNGNLRITPAPGTGRQFRFYVRGKFWVLNGSTPSDAITADDSTFLIPERILKVGLKAQYKESNGLPGAAADMSEFFQQFGLWVAETNPLGAISLESKPAESIRYPSVQEGSWNV